jgi:uncharacterized protein YyaL (SSP411 family)
MHRSIAVLVLSLALATTAYAGADATWRQSMPPASLARFNLLTAEVEGHYDTTRGGYVEKGGLPNENAISLALVMGDEGQGAQWTSHALGTLDWMRALADSSGGGYYDHRPDVESPAAMIDKTTAAHARRLEDQIDAWQLTGDDSYRKNAAWIADFVSRVLLDARGGFVVAQIGDRDPFPVPNGLMIHAWLRWAVANADTRTRDFAFKSIDRVWSHAWVDDSGLVEFGTFGEPLSHPLLLDQVEMGRALVLASRVGGRPQDRQRATQLGDLLLSQFEDTQRGGFRSQVVHARDGNVKKGSRDMYENARAVLFLYELARLTGDARYHAAADRAVAAFDDQFDKLKLNAADWALAIRAGSVDDLPAAPAWHAVAEDVKPETEHTHIYHTKKR